MHPSRQGRRLGGGGVGWWMGLPVHLCGRGGPLAGLPCGSQIPSYSSLSVRSLRDLDHHVTACSEGAKACWGGGGAGPAFGPAPFLLGGGGGSKRSAPLFPGPQGEPAHGLHPRFVVAEIWADRVLGGGVSQGTCCFDIVTTQNDHPTYVKHVLGRIYMFSRLFGY